MESGRYTAAARWMHWISAVVVLGLVPVGLYLGHFDPPKGPLTDRLYNLHESFGVLLWALVLVRLISRQFAGVPPMPADTPRALRLAATLNHWALYAVLAIQPITGFLANNAGGYNLTLFSVLSVPDPIGKNENLSHTLLALHQYGGWTLIVLVSMHLAGAAYHAFIRRDGVVRRMA
jgi:cytochrome b561